MDLKIAVSQFIPLTSYLLIKRDEVATQTESGIIIPEASKVPAQTGRVVAVGPDATTPLNTRLLYGKYSGTNITINGTDYLLMPEKEAIARVTDAVTSDPLTGGVANA